MTPPDEQPPAPETGDHDPPTSAPSGATAPTARIPTVPTSQPLDDEALRGLEALLFLADEPLDAAGLAELLEADPEHVDAALQQLSETYEHQGRGLAIRAVAGGWRMYTAPSVRPIVERWALAGRTGRLTQAALETLAVIAYKQPIGRQEIGDIRGVNADGAVRNLVARGFVEEVGRDPGPGQAALFGTTRLLLERLGIGSLDDLPPLTDFLPEAPAPDEPDLGALKEVRRRLASGAELSSLGGRSAAETNTGTSEDDPADDEAMPAPTVAVGEHRLDDEMDQLTDRLEAVARNAVDQLRAAVAAGDRDATDPDAEAERAADPAADAGSAAPDHADLPADPADDAGPPDQDGPDRG
jgi:segregation and condensation protein B